MLIQVLKCKIVTSKYF